jgi:protein-S-isoprenylcysteine O-methyltransferase Ste14
MLVQVVIGFIIYGILFFVPAGTIDWYEAWVFLIITFCYVLLVVFYFWKKDPTILQSRSKVKPEKGFDTVFLLLAGIAFFSMFLITAFNVRFDGPRVPIELELLAYVAVIISFVILFFVMRENAYASKSIRVEEGQKVITTGLYAYIRHPMYSGFLIMTLAFPIALGSFLALPPAIIVVFLMAIRAYYEEKTLIKELEGYKEYMEKVRYRLVPKIW